MNFKPVFTALLTLLFLPAVPAAPQGQSLSKAESPAKSNSPIAQQWIAAWNSHDPEKMLPLFTDDVLYEDVAFGSVNHGKTELRKFVADEYEGVPDLNLKLLRTNFQGNHGTIEWSFSGTDKGVFKTGKKFSVRGVSVIDLRDGKISRNLDFYDSATIMRQVGLLPAQ
jgi:steroid delta-isomerase-like uncharacterized protein